MLGTALSALGGASDMFGGGDMDTASASSGGVSFSTGSFGGKDWTDIIPFVLLAVLVALWIKEGR